MFQDSLWQAPCPIESKRATDTYGELLDGAGGLDVLQGGLEISELGLDLGSGELGALKLYDSGRPNVERWVSGRA